MMCTIGAANTAYRRERFDRKVYLGRRSIEVHGYSSKLRKEPMT